MNKLKEGQIISGSIFPEQVRIISLVEMGESIKVIGEGLSSGQVHQPILTEEQKAKQKKLRELQGNRPNIRILPAPGGVRPRKIQPRNVKPLKIQPKLFKLQPRKEKPLKRDKIS